MGHDRARSDALVFFGATGDLAYKKIFPALQSMARRGRLDFPVVGVAKVGLDARRSCVERARASLTEHGGGSTRPRSRRSPSASRYVDGDYDDAATFVAVRAELGGARAPGALPGHPAQHVPDGRRAAAARRA